MTDPDAYIDAVAPVLGVPIAPSHRPGVALNLRLAARMAALIETKPLGKADEAAPVFVATGSAR